MYAASCKKPKYRKGLTININVDINEHKILTFESKQKEYGNGFIISKKWKDYFMYKFWKVSDRQQSMCIIAILRSKEPIYEVNSEGKDG